LITASKANDALSKFYVEHLRKGDGPASAGLFAPDSAALIAQLQAADQTYSVEDGLIETPSAHFFFGNRNRSPTDRPEHFVHANLADGVIGYWIADWPERKLLTTLGATLKTQKIHLTFPVSRQVEVARFAEGEIDYLPHARQLVPGRAVIGVVLRTSDLKATRHALKSVKVVERGSSLFVPPELAHGLWLEFREQAR
jgi:hypothetical protein